MKKIYTAPLTKVVKINPVQMFCSSPTTQSLDVYSTQIENAGDIGGKDDFEDFDESLW